MQPLHRGILYLFYQDEIHEYDLDVGDLVTGESQSQVSEFIPGAGWLVGP